MKNQAKAIKAIIASPPRPAPIPIAAFAPGDRLEHGEDKAVGVLEDVGVLDEVGLGGPEVLFGSRPLCISNISD